MQSVYGNLNQDESIKRAKQYLLQYHDWKAKARQLKPRLGSPTMDGMPKGDRVDPDSAMVNYVNAQYEWKSREWVIDEINSWGDEYETYADILAMRFVYHRWTKVEVGIKLHLSSRTLDRLQRRALWEAVKIIRDPSVRVLA